MTMPATTPQTVIASRIRNRSNTAIAASPWGFDQGFDLRAAGRRSIRKRSKFDHLHGAGHLPIMRANTAN
jgi:hypothetical protein